MISDNFTQSGVQQENPETLVGQGFHLLSQGRDAAAANLSRDLLKKYPQEVPVLYFASEVALINEDPEAALKWINSAIEKAPDIADLPMQKGRILVGLRRRHEACAAATTAARLASANLEMLKAAGLMMSQCEDFIGARKLFEQALALASDNLELLFNLATVCFFLGDIEAAEKNLEKILNISPKNGSAIHLRSILRKSTEENNHINELNKHISNGMKGWEEAMYFNFALAREYEDTEQYDKSFETLKKGATLRRQHLTYDAKSERENINDIIRQYSRNVFEDSSGGCDRDGAIFIVGMPRTGTTLIERILASHSQVISVGESSDFPAAMTDQIRKTLAQRSQDNLSTIEASLAMDFAELGQNYLNSVWEPNSGQEIIGESRYFVDKLPFNFLYCGLIRKALPKARIIHLVRNPMDSCYAIYKTLFNQVYSFSYDLDELGEYYLLYRKLMAHWHRVMPGEILDVVYEDVVHHPEKEVRRLLEWCGLPWQESVLDFHGSQTASSTASAAQIRQPIYTSSVQKWRHYDRQLVPLKNKLVRAGLIKEDGAE